MNTDQKCHEDELTLSSTPSSVKWEHPHVSFLPLDPKCQPKAGSNLAFSAGSALAEQQCLWPCPARPLPPCWDEFICSNSITFPSLENTPCYQKGNSSFPLVLIDLEENSLSLPVVLSPTGMSSGIEVSQKGLMAEPCCSEFFPRRYKCPWMCSSF